MRLVVSVLLASFVALGAACSGSDGAPLGGPYGGTGSVPPPNPQQSTDGTDPAATDDDAGASSGKTSSGSSGKSSSGSSGSSSGSSGSSSGSSGSSGTSSGSSGASSGSSGAVTPTWTQIYNAYLKSGTTGRCPDCHSSTSSASKAYTWLKGKGQIPGIEDPSQSCLSWLGGNMPPSGPSSNAKATADLQAWAKAGSPNN